jgi:hypothetical protein
MPRPLATITHGGIVGLVAVALELGGRRFRAYLRRQGF